MALRCCASFVCLFVSQEEKERKAAEKKIEKERQKSSQRKSSISVKTTSGVSKASDANADGDDDCDDDPVQWREDARGDNASSAGVYHTHSVAQGGGGASPSESTNHYGLPVEPVYKTTGLPLGEFKQSRHNGVPCTAPDRHHNRAHTHTHTHTHTRTRMYQECVVGAMPSAVHFFLVCDQLAH
jgi:hypothetical protein